MTQGNLINFMPFAMTKSGGTHGISFEIDKVNGTVTINGKNDTSSEYLIWISGPSLGIERQVFPFDVIISGNPADASYNTYYLGGNSIVACNTEKLIPANSPIDVCIIIKSAVVCDNVIFRPMIRPAYINSSTYATYAKSIQDLSRNIAGLDWFLLGNYDLTEEIDYQDLREGENIYNLYINNLCIRELFFHIGASNNIQTYGGSGIYIPDSRFGLAHPYMENIYSQQSTSSIDWAVYVFWTIESRDCKSHKITFHINKNYCNQVCRFSIFYRTR